MQRLRAQAWSRNGVALPWVERRAEAVIARQDLEPLAGLEHDEALAVLGRAAGLLAEAGR